MRHKKVISEELPYVHVYSAYACGSPCLQSRSYNVLSLLWLKIHTAGRILEYKRTNRREEPISCWRVWVSDAGSSKDPLIPSSATDLVV